jgi:hypothetical protein
MSVAGIFASGLFSDIGSEIAQKPPSTPSPNQGAQSTFSAVHRQLSSQGSNSGAGATSLSAQMTQLGQDLKSGNLLAAQTDFSTIRTALAQDSSLHLRHRTAGPLSSESSATQAGSTGVFSQSGAGTDPLMAAMQAYSSLQQNPIDSAFGASLATPASTLAVDA